MQTATKSFEVKPQQTVSLAAYLIWKSQMEHAYGTLLYSNSPKTPAAPTKGDN